MKNLENERSDPKVRGALQGAVCGCREPAEGEERAKAAKEAEAVYYSQGRGYYETKDWGKHI